jgi:hypothetical protein
MYTYLSTYVMTPFAFVIMLILIIISYYGVSSLGTSGTNNMRDLYEPNEGLTSGITLVAIIIGIMLMLFILVNMLQYLFQVNMFDFIKKIFEPVVQLPAAEYITHLPVPVTVPVELGLKKQVFNIPGNYYTYNEASALCTAYDSKLATYDQLEKAYNNGAEWCNYGWSADQLALFPTQAKTYDTLQKIKGHENDCGRPGINGGYIANKDIEFGVNCYGKKPQITQEETNLMKIADAYPDNQQDIDFQKNVDLIKANLDNILVSPFNKNMWNSA